MGKKKSKHGIRFAIPLGSTNRAIVLKQLAATVCDMASRRQCVFDNSVIPQLVHDAIGSNPKQMEWLHTLADSAQCPEQYPVCNAD